MTAASDTTTAGVGSPEITATLIRFTGAMFTDRALERGTPVNITVTLDDGTELAHGFGQIEEVKERDVYKKVDGARVLDHAEQIHVAKVS